MRLSSDLVKIFRDLKNEMIKIGRDFKVGLSDLVSAFKQREMFNVLKAFKFNIKLMFRAMGEASKALKGGLLTVFKEMYKTKAIQKLRSGALKVDDLLNKYPKLKVIGGVVIAGLLLYIWLNMTFIGDLDYDFNFSDTISALHGKYSIADLFVSPQGLMLIALFGSGTALGLSMPWLGKTAYNLTLAIVYTAYHKLKGHDRKFKDVVGRFKSKLKKERIR